VLLSIGLARSPQVPFLGEGDVPSDERVGAAADEGESVIKYKSPLNVLKDICDYSCY
jgi:hypothetical protein